MSDLSGPAADTGTSVDEAVPPADGSKERLQYELRQAWAAYDEQRRELERLRAEHKRASAAEHHLVEMHRELRMAVGRALGLPGPHMVWTVATAVAAVERLQSRDEAAQAVVQSARVLAAQFPEAHGDSPVAALMRALRQYDALVRAHGQAPAEVPWADDPDSLDRARPRIGWHENATEEARD